MSLRHILLGMLAEPASGYDLKRKFNQSLVHFWGAELAQIYPTLRGLVDDGLLEVSVHPSEQGPQRKVYRRTKEGTGSLRAWLAQGPVVKRERISYLAQVFFLHELDGPERKREFLLQLRERMAGRLATLQAIEAGWSADDPRYPDDLPDAAFYPQLTLRLGLLKTAAAVEWCEESIARLDRRAQRSGAAGKSSSVS